MTKNNVSRNRRTKERRKRRRNEIKSSALDEELYAESKLDPQTSEGQSRLPMHRISPAEQPQVPSTTFLDTLKYWFIPSFFNPKQAQELTG